MITNFCQKKLTKYAMMPIDGNHNNKIISFLTP